MLIGRAGGLPWGQFDPANNDDIYGPQCTGIPGSIRFIYVPEPDSIVVRQLDPTTAYSATYFDPVTGEETQLDSIRPGADGSWICAPPAGQEHDWVLILEGAKAKVQGAKTEKRVEGRGPGARHEPVAKPRDNSTSKQTPLARLKNGG